MQSRSLRACRNGCLMRKRQAGSLGLDVWPVEGPVDPFELDLCAEIWAYDPRLDVWERAFKSPMIEGFSCSFQPLAAISF